MAAEASRRFAEMAAHWVRVGYTHNPLTLALVLSLALALALTLTTDPDQVRVGYTQSNFNSDNCLIGGVTVDFGPFGFIERCART